MVADRPENIIDYFEEYSRKVKQENLVLHDSLRDVYVPSAYLDSAKNQLSLVNSYGIKEEIEEPLAGEEEEAHEPNKKMDLEEIAFYFRQAGIVIPDTQLFTINIAIKKLTEENNLQKPRFWGKVFGIKQDYFVFECELTEEDYEKKAEEDEQTEEAERLKAERLASKEVAMLAAEEAERSAAAADKDILVTEQAEEKVESEERASSKIVEEEEEPEKVEDDKHSETVEAEDKDKTQSVRSGAEHVTFQEVEDVIQEEDQEDALLPPLPPPKKLLKYKVPPLLKPIMKDIVKIPSEKIGQGLNRKIYYVTNTPELDWIELPKVTPEEINVARQIKLYFTGDLETKVNSYPAFKGSEKNYLRAQIARISAATQVSPLGFYKFGGTGGEEEEEEEVAEEEEEEGAQKNTYVENLKFQPIPIRDLIDPTFASWVHHSHHILKQGRTEFWSAKKAGAAEEEAEEEQEEEEEEEGGEGAKGEEKEAGPALLTPLSEDVTIEGMPAWTVRKTHTYNNEFAAAFIKSNLWPGSCAFAVGKKFENVYYGWGHKHLPHGFSPAMLPHPEYEYDLGPEIMEIQDPTVEVEEAWRQAHKKKPPLPEGGEEEGEEGEEEEEEEEDDD